MNSTLNEQKILREKRINSLQKDIFEITRISAKQDQTQDKTSFQRRINEKQEILNILTRQNNANKK
jgi:hypothetical protein